MDGLDRLIEMLETRFGKLWGDLLLLVFVLGAVSWSINASMTYVVIPVATALSGWYASLAGTRLSLPNGLTSDRIIAVATALIPITTVILGFVNRRLRRRLDNVESGILKELEEHCEMIRVLQAREAEHLNTIKELKERIGVLDGSALGT